MTNRIEQNIYECSQDLDFDWEAYQEMCDIADYWDSEE